VSLIDRLGIEECDLCHEYLPVRQIEYNGTQFLCEKCRSEGEKGEKGEKSLQTSAGLTLGVKGL